MVSSENLEHAIEQLMSISQKLQDLANENEIKLEDDQRLKIRRAIEKNDKEEILSQARNMVRATKEQVTNYHQVASRLDSLYEFLDEKPWLENIYQAIPTFHKSVDSFIETRNLQKMLETIDQIEEKYFEETVLAKFKSWAASKKGTPVLMSEDDEVNTLIQQVTDEYEWEKAGTHEPSKDLYPEARSEKKWCVIM